MTRFVDLLHGQEELRFCSALAVLLAHEKDKHPLLKGILEKVLAQENKRQDKKQKKQEDEGQEKKGWIVNRNPPFSIESIEEPSSREGLRRVRIRVEEPVKGPKNTEGRLDLTVRFMLGEKEYLLIFEAKVAAPGAHGNQFETYLSQFKEWDRKKHDTCGEKNRIFGMLTIVSFDDFQWHEKGGNDPDEGKKKIDFWIHWDDIADAVENVMKDHEGTEYGKMMENFAKSLRNYTMKLSTIRNALKSDHPPFPVIVDAIEYFMKELKKACGKQKIHWEPPRWQMPVWEDFESDDGEECDGAYWCGGWWRTRNKEDSGEKDSSGGPWFGIYLRWDYYETLSEKDDLSDCDVVRYDDGSGYSCYIKMMHGRGEKKESNKRDDNWKFTFGQFKEYLEEDKFQGLAKWINEGCEGKPPNN